MKDSHFRRQIRKAARRWDRALDASARAYRGVMKLDPMEKRALESVERWWNRISTMGYFQGRAQVIERGICDNGMIGRTPRCP